MVAAVGCWAHPCVRATVSKPKASQLKLVLELAPGFRDSPSFFRLTELTLRYSSLRLGRPPLQVQFRPFERGAEYLFDLPTAEPFLVRAREGTARLSLLMRQRIQQLQSEVRSLREGPLGSPADRSCAAARGAVEAHAAPAGRPRPGRHRSVES